jgi:hypothetical protein
VPGPYPLVIDKWEQTTQYQVRRASPSMIRKGGPPSDVMTPKCGLDAPAAQDAVEPFSSARSE